MVYKKVENFEEELVFNRIWINVWEEKNFSEEDTFASDKYLIKHDDNYVGTVEFVTYFTGNGSSIDTHYPFNSLDVIQQNVGRVVELEKVAILKEHRSKKVLDALLYTMIEYGILHNVLYYIAIVEPKFYRTLRLGYHLPIEKLGVTESNSEKFYPMILNCTDFLDHKDKFTWYTSIIEKQQVPQHAKV